MVMGNLAVVGLILLGTFIGMMLPFRIKIGLGAKPAKPQYEEEVSRAKETD